MSKKHPYENCGYKYWFFGLGEIYQHKEKEGFYWAAWLFGWRLIDYTKTKNAAALYLFNRSVCYLVEDAILIGNFQKGVR